MPLEFIKHFHWSYLIQSFQQLSVLGRSDTESLFCNNMDVPVLGSSGDWLLEAELGLEHLSPYYLFRNLPTVTWRSKEL